MPYRQTEGLIKATIGKKLPTDKTPSYSQICRRTNKLDIDINYRINDNNDDDSIVIAIDSTGIKVTNRGQWMQDKWNIGKRGYLKIHVAVDIKTKELLALEVTDEKVYDGKVMVQLVEKVLENKNIKIKSVLADGGHMKVIRISNTFKRKRFHQVSKLERIPSSHAKTICSEIEKLVLRLKIC